MGNFKIREFRKAKGLFQDEFAKIVGLTQSNLSRYETNDVDLTDDCLKKLREHFGDEEVDKYMNEYSTTIHEHRESYRVPDDATIPELVGIVKKQNETICRQVEAQDELNRQLMNINSRLISLLEKVQFE